MDWTSSFISAINFIEEHLLEDLDIDEIANKAFISSFYFQKVFSIYTGYSISEYIRSRRLYQAALDLKSTKESVIEVAYKYGYDTPEAFTKAFTRFHGITPSKARNPKSPIKYFLPLHITISIRGGNNMDFVIEDIKELKFIGFEKEIGDEVGYIECPKFWDEFNEKYCNGKVEESIAKAIKENMVGAFAICHDGNGKSFKYMIGGLYKEGDVPKGMKVITLPDSKWAKFKCVGPIPGALQSVNTKIWHDWIPNNPKYELAFNADIEWYSNGDISSSNYESEIWLPIKEK